MGPLAALGDGFFWLSLRPACGAVAALLALALMLAGHPLAGAAAGVSVYLLTYNVVHIVLRARFFRLGYLLGDRVVDRIAASRLPSAGRRLRALAAAAAGAAGALSAQALPLAPPLARWVGPAAVVLFAACYWALGRGVSAYLLFYASAALALCICVFF